MKIYLEKEKEKKRRLCKTNYTFLLVFDFGLKSFASLNIDNNFRTHEILQLSLLTSDLILIFRGRRPQCDLILRPSYVVSPMSCGRGAIKAKACIFSLIFAGFCWTVSRVVFPFRGKRTRTRDVISFICFIVLIRFSQKSFKTLRGDISNTIGFLKVLTLSALFVFFFSDFLVFRSFLCFN